MRILLADDHDLVRDALGALLSHHAPDTQVTLAATLDEALDQVSTEDGFDAVILDLNMPGMAGLSGVQRMIEAVDPVPVILMSGHARATEVRAALNDGVRGFLPKTLSGNALYTAIQLVISGEVYVPTSVMMEADTNTAQAAFGVTPREFEVLEQLRQGLSNKEIARQLASTESTVKLHIRSLATRLEARNRTDIVIRAIDAALI